MLLVHPMIQSLAVLLTLYVLYLGVQRFRSLHLTHKTVFRWKRHAALGKTALGGLLVGMAGGMTMVYLYWRGVFITGMHPKIAIVMAPLIVLGLVSGLYMNRNKKKRKTLPLLHGLTNVIVSILALMQVATGWGVYVAFVLGE